MSTVSEKDTAIRTAALTAAVRGSREWNGYGVDSHAKDIIALALHFEDYLRGSAR